MQSAFWSSQADVCSGAREPPPGAGIRSFDGHVSVVAVTLPHFILAKRGPFPPQSVASTVIGTSRKPLTCNCDQECFLPLARCHASEAAAVFQWISCVGTGRIAASHVGWVSGFHHAMRRVNEVIACLKDHFSGRMTVRRRSPGSSRTRPPSARSQSSGSSSGQSRTCAVQMRPHESAETDAAGAQTRRSWLDHGKNTFGVKTRDTCLRTRSIIA